MWYPTFWTKPLVTTFSRANYPWLENLWESIGNMVIFLCPVIFLVTILSKSKKLLDHQILWWFLATWWQITGGVLSALGSLVVWQTFCLCLVTWPNGKSWCKVKCPYPATERSYFSGFQFPLETKKHKETQRNKSMYFLPHLFGIMLTSCRI